MTILLVEDYKYLSIFIKHSLSTENVVCVDSLKSANTYLSKNKIDLILLDLNLPDSNGIDTLKGLKIENIPIIIITGSIDCAAEAAKYKIYDYIVKETLSEIINRTKRCIENIKNQTPPPINPIIFNKIKPYICLSFA